jgi:sugar O-acyltransferase (sialic acid O-acetyltransferase NeuD family)
MIIVGAKGFAKEVLEILYINKEDAEIFFYDDISADVPDKLFDRFSVIKSAEEAKIIFEKKNDPRFVLGIGKPQLRKIFSEKMISLGGKLTPLVSKNSCIGHFGNIIESGVTICAGCNITNDVFIGKGTLINLNCTIGHDVKINEYCELSPGVHISGKVIMDEMCLIGTGAVILPGVQLGKNVTVGAGAVVNKNVAANITVIGIPAKPLLK